VVLLPPVTGVTLPPFLFRGRRLFIVFADWRRGRRHGPLRRAASVAFAPCLGLELAQGAVYHCNASCSTKT
jgi:hypothetical protein